MYKRQGPTHGEDIALASVSPAGIESSTYPLNEGVNKIKINRSGWLYVMYHTDSSTPKKPVKVHIPVGSGTVNGYLDVTRHTDKDWKRMIGKAPHSMFDIVGRYSMMILQDVYKRQGAQYSAVVTAAFFRFPPFACMPEF